MIALVPIRCCICDVECNDINHNAAPLKLGRCCPDCNLMVVIPTRLNILTSGVLTEMDNYEPNNEPQ